MSAGTNIDWLLHIYFARRDFTRCKRLIERELYRHLNPEYLYFVKVSTAAADPTHTPSFHSKHNHLALANDE